jgi:riboflavin biosynthesis pyrimidine reductase
VTRSGAFDATGPALDGALVFTTANGEASLRARIPPRARVVALGKEALVLTDVLAFLRNEGAGLVLTEGGPSLAAELIAAGALDELFLTVSPALFGRSDGDHRKSLAHGADLGGAPLELASLRRHGSHLFARYELGQRGSTP